MEAAAVAPARVVVDDRGADDRRAASRTRDRDAATASFREVAPDRAIDDRHGSRAENASTQALHRGVVGHGAPGDEQSTEAGNTAAPAALDAAAREDEVVGHRAMGDDKRAPIENAAAAERDRPAPAAASHREVFEIQEAGLRDVEDTELRGGGGTLDDGVHGAVSADRERTRDRWKAIRSVGVVVDCRQREGARRQADQVHLAVRIGRVDRCDQARDVASGTGEKRRARRSRESQGNHERRQDDPHSTST